MMYFSYFWSTKLYLFYFYNRNICAFKEFGNLVKSRQRMIQTILFRPSFFFISCFLSSFANPYASSRSLNAGVLRAQFWDVFSSLLTFSFHMTLSSIMTFKNICMLTTLNVYLQPLTLKTFQIFMPTWILNILTCTLNLKLNIFIVKFLIFLQLSSSSAIQL